MSYDLGQYAYKAGKPIETNPFKINTEEARDFDKGWKDEHARNFKIAKLEYKRAKRCSPN